MSFERGKVYVAETIGCRIGVHMGHSGSMRYEVVCNVEGVEGLQFGLLALEA